MSTEPLAPGERERLPERATLRAIGYDVRQEGYLWAAYAPSVYDGVAPTCLAEGSARHVDALWDNCARHLLLVRKTFGFCYAEGTVEEVIARAITGFANHAQTSHFKGAGLSGRLVRTDHPKVIAEAREADAEIAALRREPAPLERERAATLEWIAREVAQTCPCCCPYCNCVGEGAATQHDPVCIVLEARRALAGASPSVAPQPVREVGCEDADGYLIVHPASETCEVCRTVAPQPAPSRALSGEVAAPREERETDTTRDGEVGDGR